MANGQISLCNSPSWSAAYSCDVRFWQESARVGGQHFDIHDHSLYMTKLDATALRMPSNVSIVNLLITRPGNVPLSRPTHWRCQCRKRALRTHKESIDLPNHAWKLEKWFHDSREGCNLFQWHTYNLGTGCKQAHVCKACRGHQALPEPWSPFLDPVWNCMHGWLFHMRLHHLTMCLKPGHYDPNLHWPQLYPQPF